VSFKATLLTRYLHWKQNYQREKVVSLIYSSFYQSRVPAVYLVSDPPTQLSTLSRGAEPSSESMASLILDLLHGTVFHTISIISVTLVFSNAASKLNYFVEHSDPGWCVISAIEMTIIIIITKM